MATIMRENLGENEVALSTSDHLAVTYRDCYLPVVLIYYSADKVCINDIIRLVVLVQQSNGRFKLLYHMFGISALEKRDHSLMILAGLGFGEVFFEPFIDRDKQLLFFLRHDLIPDQIPAKTENALGVLGYI